MVEALLDGDDQVTIRIIEKCNINIIEFKKYFKNSPSKWFQEKRLKHAAFLLKNKPIRPSDIYLEVGYETLSNFIQAFKMKFGQTPKQYQSN